MKGELTNVNGDQSMDAVYADIKKIWRPNNDYNWDEREIDLMRHAGHVA